MEDILLNRKLLKTLFCKEKKQNKTKQNKKERDEKKKVKLICCGNSTPGWTYGKFLSLSCKSELTVLQRNQCSNMKSIPLTNKYPVERP